MMIQIGATTRMPRLSTPEHEMINPPQTTVLTFHRCIPSVAKDVDGEGEKDAGAAHEVMVLNGRWRDTIALQSIITTVVRTHTVCQISVQHNLQLLLDDRACEDSWNEMITVGCIDWQIACLSHAYLQFYVLPNKRLCSCFSQTELLNMIISQSSDLYAFPKRMKAVHASQILSTVFVPQVFFSFMLHTLLLVSSLSKYRA